MAKFHIEKPLELKIERPSSKRKKKRFFPAFLAVLLILCVASVIGFLILRKGPVSVNLPVLEIENASGSVEVFDPQVNSWQKAGPGSRLAPGGRLKTAAGSEADFQIPGVIKARLKSESELIYKLPGYGEKTSNLSFLVAKGEFLAATENRSSDSSTALPGLVFSSPDLKARADQGYFYLKSEPDGKSTFGVMRGRAEVSKNGWGIRKWAPMASLFFVSSSGGKLEAPRRISRDEWNEMREVYELTIKTAAMEAVQMDLSKKAGSLFRFVFDHGTFYTPKFGYSGREFFLDESTGESYLEMEYDVFPKGSFVGMYIKTRGLDLSRFSNLEFEMRKSPGGEGEPKTIRIELKSKNGLVRAFAAKLPQKQWQKLSFPLYVRTPTEMNEMTFVFLHDRVGEFMKGTVQIRRINLVEAPVSEPAGQETEKEQNKTGRGAQAPADAVPAPAAPAPGEAGEVPSAVQPSNETPAAEAASLAAGAAPR